MSVWRRNWVLSGVAATVAATVAVYCLARPWCTVPADCDDAGRPPRLDPDYTNCTIPPNIAPLNFVVKEDGTDYRVRVYSQPGDGFLVASSSPEVTLPATKWQALLDTNCGRDLHFDVYVREEQGRWLRFGTITNQIAEEDVDSYVVYRRLKPVHNVFRNMGTYQRNLSTYEESPVLLSDRSSGRCVNCHTFANNAPDTMCLLLRSPKDGPAMLLVKDGKVSKVDTRTPLNSSPASYTSWHPNRQLVAFSAIQVMQLHHAVGNSDDVFVHASDVGVYDTESNRVTSPPELADPDRLEIFPAWSPDGKHLYFCSAERLWEEGLKDKHLLPLDYQKARYDLMRISYYEASGTWGELEPVLLSKDTGLSINEPRISPDGRFLLFCMTDYGCFPVFRQVSDLYVLDLETGQHRPLEVLNSEHSDSWPSWSSNGRWILFASKRRDGLFGRAYLSHFDAVGNAHKPVLLPQKDPSFYASCVDNFNAPELIVAPIRIKQQELVRAIERPQALDAEFAGTAPPSGGVDPEQGPLAPDESGAAEPEVRVARGKTADLVAVQQAFARGTNAERDGRIEEAMRYYRQSIENAPQDDPAIIPAANRLAQIYATHPSKRFRDGEEAVLLATRACHITTSMAQSAGDEHMRRNVLASLPGLMESLAAAYAENGQFPMATHTALKAETLALGQGQFELALKIRDRLKLYLADRPYHGRP
ncbi:MAG: hypothetical protein ABIP48_24545 [Planctomycetota bacterium]